MIQDNSVKANNLNIYFMLGSRLSTALNNTKDLTLF
jgi:hypothetical protein